MEGAYNDFMYKKPKCRAKDQEPYCEHVHQEWCEGKPVTDEHQKPSARLNIGTGGTQSSAKPSQF